MKGRVISLFIIDFFSYVYRTNFFICQIFRAHFVHYTRNFFVRVVPKFRTSRKFSFASNFHRTANSTLCQILRSCKFRAAANFKELGAAPELDHGWDF